MCESRHLQAAQDPMQRRHSLGERGNLAPRRRQTWQPFCLVFVVLYDPLTSIAMQVGRVGLFNARLLLLWCRSFMRVMKRGR